MGTPFFRWEINLDYASGPHGRRGGENKQETEILRFSVYPPHAPWKTEPGQSRLGGGRAFKSYRKNNSNNGVRPNREGERWSWWKASLPQRAKKLASGSREKTARACLTRPERREAMKGGEGEESSEQARSEQAPAERGVAAAR